MNREFVLRDNEVAINRPDGTVIIMNLNALRELKGDSDETKTLKSKLTAAGQHISVLLAEQAKLRKEVEDWKNRHKNMSDERNRLAIEVRDLRDQYTDRLGEANKKVNDLKAETEVLRNQLESVLKERDEFYNENDRLTRQVCSKNAEIQKLQQKLHQYFNQMVLFGPTENPIPSTPDQMPDHVYIAHTGEVFFSQRDVEKAYNLAKGSVSAYFNDKQTALYARDPWGNRITDKQTGKEVTIGLVRRSSNMIFKNRDINRPVWDNYEFAITCAQGFVL